LGRDDNTLLSGARPDGRELAEVITLIDRHARWNGHARPWLISDHNGEPYRAHEWGLALFHLGVQFPNMGDAAVWMPAGSFGDTGAASAAVAIAMVCEALRRQYAPSPGAVIVSSAEAGGRSAILLTR
jgi:3-oxoacyl-[acyl-carrier-protein] synthase-1